MRIAQVSTLSTPVRPGRAGSIETLVRHLAHEMTTRGHEVTVFAAGGSEVAPARLVETVAAPYSWEGGMDDWQLAEWINLCRAVEQSSDFDVVHTHAYLFGLPLAALCRARLVATTHVMPTEDAAALRRSHPDVCVTALSENQWSAYPDLPPVPVIPHGLDPEVLHPSSDVGDHLVWLGRFMPSKGPLAAVQAARAAGRRLVLAGPRNAYFARVVAPYVDGKDVEYAGYLGEQERTRLLASAAALLYPLTDPEPFGLVIIEALLCGTPVAALRVGAVPELLDEGVTGVSSTTVEELAASLADITGLDRAAVRARAVERFSASRMAEAYLRVYEGLQA